MTKITVFLLLAMSIISSDLTAQDPELFKGEKLLSPCLLNIPLTYKSKDKAECEKAAVSLKDVKLILLRSDKKTNTAYYSEYYIVVNRFPNETFVFLEKPEDHNPENTCKRAIFLEFNPKTDRFYKAECFEKVLLENPELKEKIVHEQQ